jgi:hypothetical protein
LPENLIINLLAMKNKTSIILKAGFKQIASLLAIILLTYATASAQTGGINFSGTWVFNESKSTPSEGGFRMGASLMTITQEANNLSVESTRKNRDGEDVKSTSKFTLDGKECVNPAGFGNSNRNSVVIWSADKKMLNFAHTMKFERDGETQEFKNTESWKLNDDKTLSVETIMNFQGEERKTTNIYDKK